MKRIKTYSEILNYLKEDKIVYEKAMSPEKIANLKRLKDSGDFKSILKILNDDINLILNKCKDLSYDDIGYSMNDDIITISYGKHIHTLLSILKDKIENYSTDDIDEKIFGGGWKDLFLEIEIDKKNLNKIDIINSLPNFMKNIGLGKKIYKKIIKDFGFISSFDGYEPSLDSSMVWESLANDKEIFTFTNDENIISFWYELNYETIIEKLSKFYKNKGFIQFDDDFLIKFNLNDKEMNNLI
jgi:hypothetical protein